MTSNQLTVTKDTTASWSLVTGHCQLVTVVGLGGLEPPTSRLSSARSNQLSYKPLSEDRGQTTENR